MRYTKKEADPFYGSPEWKAARAEALRRDGYKCVWCMAAGRKITLASGLRVPVPADMVHHIKPRKLFPELSLRLDNLVSLCNACHDRAHPEKHERAEKPKNGPDTSRARIIKM